MGRRTYIPQRGQTEQRSRMLYTGLDGVKRCVYTGEKTKCTGEELNHIVLMYLMYMAARNKSGSMLRDRLRKVPARVGVLAIRRGPAGPGDGRDLLHDAAGAD